ncbi:MAG: CYTH domain-containing protein [Bacteroidetes bacterium]|nr:MAG: CYTH domain-containing protein [Bacteroidota bacterium]
MYYSRNEAGNQRLSDFIIYPVQNPVELKNVLTLSLGLKIQVVKRRILYMYKTTRIHIDDVKELGAFLEFEVPVENSEQEAQGIMDLLISEFAITGEDFIKESYSDMLLKR